MGRPGLIQRNQRCQLQSQCCKTRTHLDLMTCGGLSLFGTRCFLGVQAGAVACGSSILGWRLSSMIKKEVMRTPVLVLVCCPLVPPTVGLHPQVASCGGLPPNTVSPIDVLSHAGNNSVHRKLVANLMEGGVRRRQFRVIYGAKLGRFQYGGRLLRYNEVVHYSFLYRWCRAVCSMLAERKTISCVFYLEADSKTNEWREVVRAADRAPGRASKGDAEFRPAIRRDS